MTSSFPWKSFGPTLRGGIVGGLILAVLGALVGLTLSKLLAPPGWGGLIYTLQGLIYGYGIGAGTGSYAIHKRLGGRRTFARAFFSALTGLFVVIFLAEPLHLDTFQPLVWGLLFILPPLTAALMLLEPITDN